MCGVSLFVRGNMVILDDWTEKQKDCGFGKCVAKSIFRISFERVSYKLETNFRLYGHYFEHQGDLNWTCDGAFEPLFH